jgi:hypothetical protein
MKAVQETVEKHVAITLEFDQIIYEHRQNKHIKNQYHVQYAWLQSDKYIH